MDNRRIFVVTGAQRGIGYGITKALAQKVQNGVIYMADLEEGALKDSQQRIQTEIAGSQKSEIRIHELDIRNATSIAKFASHLCSEHGGLDVLINDAAIRFIHQNQSEETLEESRLTLETNYEGTKRISEALFPLMRNGGRVVNMASRCGNIRAYSREMKAKLTNPELTLDDIDKFVAGFLKATEENNRLAMGYPKSSYCVSKTAVLLLAQVWSRELKARNIVVNACCPGFVNTEMSCGMKSPLTIEQGAITPVYLATLSSNQPNGAFIYQCKPIPWY